MELHGEETVLDQEKRIASVFMLHSPPGEFNEVFNDVKVLLNNDVLLKEVASETFSQYSKDQLTPVIIENSSHPVLLTKYNDIGGYRFFDPRSKQSFKYDNLKNEVVDYERWEPDNRTELWRLPLELKLDEYTLSHYNNGTSNVFARRKDGSIILTACIEAHKFQPNYFWNGCWRSQWSVILNNGSAEICGILKVQVHYYEDCNIQLITSKDIKETMVVSNKEQFVKDLINLVEKLESNYQEAIYDSYQIMLNTTFKALRRQLPLTRTKIDWNKIVSYRIGKELKSL